MAPGVNTNEGADFTLGSRERRLEIGIIGAGIAGLGAAIALGRAGHDVEVSRSLALSTSASDSFCRAMPLIHILRTGF
jgi:glycine/D-amino acid oxidase-like deaminating enzyme